jgi:hypothetical protein
MKRLGCRDRRPEPSSINLTQSSYRRQPWQIVTLWFRRSITSTHPHQCWRWERKGLKLLLDPLVRIEWQFDLEIVPMLGGGDNKSSSLKRAWCVRLGMWIACLSNHPALNPPALMSAC